ncbi:hypothetical protein BKA65DRAFT_511309 [Rhexocercosporidium sp. MPI-PUGE-AT-0058]|nr:hypothetical protein BKA65DRAFT_511309 [Rhexocercosporidium sp. MPI-PUGE-AT-0058]
MTIIQHITNKASHSHFTSTAESIGLPSVLYVYNSSLPACKIFTPEYEKLAARYTSENEGKITFAQIGFTSETSMLFKFSPNQLPLLTLICRQCKKGGGSVGEDGYGCGFGGAGEGDWEVKFGLLYWV